MDNDTIYGGCILLSRNILFSEIWRKPPEYLKIFLYILLKVNHKDGLFPRGSNFFNFREDRPNGVKITQVYEFLRWAKSEKVQFCTTEKTTRGIILKVNNYDHYQSLENYQNQNKNQLSYNSDTTQIQHYKQECNNEIKNNIIHIEEKTKKFIPPTLEEIKKYCLKRNNGVDPQRFFDYYNAGGWKDSKGKPIKNWKQKIIAVWETKDEGEKSAKNKKISSGENFYMSLSK